jgi:hypothetical protein
MLAQMISLLSQLISSHISNSQLVIEIYFSRCRPLSIIFNIPLLFSNHCIRFVAYSNSSSGFLYIIQSLYLGLKFLAIVLVFTISKHCNMKKSNKNITTRCKALPSDFLLVRLCLLSFVPFEHFAQFSRDFHSNRTKI